MGVITDETAILDYHRERVKKAYPAYFDTYAEMDKLIEYLNQFENLYCVGRNGSRLERGASFDRCANKFSLLLPPAALKCVARHHLSTTPYFIFNCFGAAGRT